MGSDLVGRDAEVAVVTNLLLRIADGGTGSCVIEGGIGIGKTALWNAALELAARHGYLVLRAHPVEAETAFSFAALADLLRPNLDEVLERLPPPQRLALVIALLIDKGGGGAPDPHAVSVAAMTTLELLAKKRPVVVAVDDVQWLDSPSRATLQFVARRLGPRIAILVTERVEDGGAPTLRVEGERLKLGPLSAGALQQLVHERMGVALPRPTLLRLHEASGGYPFYALEIARALLASGSDLGATDPLPVPGTLRQLVARRLATISSTTRAALIAVAASARPAPNLVPADALREAIAAEVLVLEGQRLRFTHPLLGSVLYADASPAERRAVHRRLADLVADEEEVARHVALATEGPNEAVASRLERAAARARARAAPTAAAELMELALEFTPGTQTTDRTRRAIDAAEFHIAGRSPGAEPLLEAVLPSATGNLRARALQLLAFRRGLVDWSAASPLFEEALEHVDDPMLELRILLELINPFLRSFDERTAVHAERAVELAEQTKDPGLIAAAVASRASILGDRDAEIARAASMEETAQSGIIARLQLAWSHLAAGDSVAGIRLLDALFEESHTAGIRWENWVVAMLSYAEGRAGDALRAKQLADEFLAAGTHEGNKLAESGGLALRAFAEACLGELASARRDVDSSIRIADAAGFEGRSIHGRAIRGFIELSTGDLEAASGFFDAAVTRLFAADLKAWPPRAHTRLAVPPLVADAVETLVGLGRAEDAEPLIAWLERDPHNPWLRALAAQGRGLVAAALGDEVRAQTKLGEAVRGLERLSVPLDYGRALLALGSAQRRARHKAEARRSLDQAVAVFQRTNAPLWLAKAQGELARIGGRQRAEVGLTPSERRVTELVAAGQSNKQVATALFISPKTVEGHLANVFAKLGVRSRAELARKVASEEILTP
jgi:DNA-binding CsgD family transcriptional regulator